MSETDALKMIREALIYASEESIYISGWRRYRDALVALNGLARSLASYRSLLSVDAPTDLRTEPLP